MIQNCEQEGFPQSNAFKALKDLASVFYPPSRICPIKKGLFPNKNDARGMIFFFFFGEINKPVF